MSRLQAFLSTAPALNQRECVGLSRALREMKGSQTHAILVIRDVLRLCLRAGMHQTFKQEISALTELFDEGLSTLFVQFTTDSVVSRSISGGKSPWGSLFIGGGRPSRPGPAIPFERGGQLRGSSGDPSDDTVQETSGMHRDPRWGIACAAEAGPRPGWSVLRPVSPE